MRRLGLTFENEYLIIQTILPWVKRKINYSDIKEMRYVRWTWGNYFKTIYNHDYTPGFLYVYFVDINTGKVKYYTAPLRYKNIEKIPQKLHKKLNLIEKFEV